MKNKKSISFNSSFSNAKFELLKLKKKIYLKKKINSPTLRDFESIEKNNFFFNNIKIRNLEINEIKIKNLKELKKKKYYLMNYIDGYSSELILKNLGVNEIKLIKEFLTNYFLVIKNFIKWEKIEKRLFLDKIKNVRKNVKHKKLRKLFKIYETSLLKKLDRIKFYPYGICHGDLTLSNIIVRNKKIYLIDFLKTYKDSIIQDLSKIYQEFVLGWSSRSLSGNDIVRSKIICENIIDKQFFNSLPKAIRIPLDFEIMLTLIRIFPYVKKNDTNTIKWLEVSLSKLK